jgi:chromosome segregation ATPase
MKAYNKQMEFLVNQGNHFIKEYNEAMREFQQDELSEEFDSLMELEGRAGDAISVLQEQSEIYKDDLTQIGEAVTELGNQYGITQLEGESMVEFMARIAQEAPVASGEILELTEKLKGTEESLREVDNNLADAFLKHFVDMQEGWNDTMEEYERGASDIAHIKEMMSLTGLDTDNPNMMR